MIINVITKKDANLLEKKINDKTNCIVLYYSETCFYCKMMKPEWNKFENKHKNNNDIIIANVEAQNMNLLNSKPMIMGYPTIYKYKNGIEKEYKGDRSCSDLEKFSNIKPKSKSKPKTKRKTKSKSKSKPKTKTKPKTKSKPKTKRKTKSKTKSK